MHYNPELIWLIILNITLFTYLISDGGALGLSVIIAFVDNHTKKLLLSSLLPVWDANQTWLVFTLAGLYGGFSLGFAEIMTLLYLPTILLLAALICRGAAIEYSQKSMSLVWFYMLALSSLLIIILQASMISILLYKLSMGYSDFIALEYMQPTVLGIVVFILFDINLSLSMKKNLLNEETEKNILLLFIFLYAILACCYPPLNHSNYMIIFTIPSLIFLIKNQHKKNTFYRWSLIFFALANMISIEAYFFPYLFPNNLSYLAVSANRVSLTWMITLSCFMLPILFTALWLFKRIYDNYFNNTFY